MARRNVNLKGRNFVLVGGGGIGSATARIVFEQGANAASKRGVLRAIYVEKTGDPIWPTLESRNALTPKRRFVSPGEIAEVIFLLPSKASAFVNSTVSAS